MVGVTSGIRVFGLLVDWAVKWAKAAQSSTGNKLDCQVSRRYFGLLTRPLPVGYWGEVTWIEAFTQGWSRQVWQSKGVVAKIVLLKDLRPRAFCSEAVIAEATRIFDMSATYI